MKISFLVTYYNQKQYVEQSLESILAIRKPCDWEILVGDDGSSDGTTDVVMQYVQRYPENIFLHVMPREQHKKYAPVQRASANRLNLLEKATGDFYCVLDGDDYYCDIDFVEEALAVYNERENIAVVMFGFKHVIDGVDGDMFTLPQKFDRCQVDKGEYLNALYNPAGACVFRKFDDPSRMALLKRIGYFDDNDIVIYNMYFGELFCINKVIYAYRQTGVSVYSSMNVVEQAVLNVQGYDIDVKLIDESFKESLWLRCSYSIIRMYLWRKKLKNILGEEKFVQYVDECRRLGDSLAYRITQYDELDKKEKKMVNDIVFFSMKKRVKFTAKLIMKKCLGMCKNWEGKS